jgi:hypothetical protein
VSLLPAGKDMSTEAEEYPLLGTVTCQCLVKAENLMCAAVQ